MSSAKSRPSAITRPHGTSKHPPSFSSSWTRVYGYDRYGNRISESTGGAPTPIQVDAGDNRLTGPGIVYDGAGNLTQNGAREYLYDAENRLVLILENGDLVAQYYYDGDGRRIKKLVVQPGQPTKRTRFVYNGGGQLVAEYEGTAPEPTQPTREYVYGPSGMLVVIEGTERKYMTADHLGSPRVITDASGTVMSRRDNLPFGEDLPAGLGGRTAAEGYSVPDDVRFRFTSYQRDDESGLDFAEARYYANLGGRFLSADPLMSSARSNNPQTWNRYAYAWNNPLRLVDPTGLDPSPADDVDYYGDKEREAEQQGAPLGPQVEKPNGSPADQEIDNALSQLFTEGGIVRGAASDRAVHPLTGDDHFQLGSGKLHTIHIYGDESGNKITGVYIPKEFSQLKFIGGDHGVVTATNPKTGEVIGVAHINVHSQKELNENLKKTNASGSRYIGDIGGEGSAKQNYAHAHLTIFPSMRSRTIALGFKTEHGELNSKVNKHLGDFRKFVKRR